VNNVISARDIWFELNSLHLDRCNAMDKDKCVYVDHDGDHCIAGEILNNLGFPLPNVNEDVNGLSVRQLLCSQYGVGWEFDPKAVVILAKLQLFADQETSDGNGCAWEVAFNEVHSLEETGELDRVLSEYPNSFRAEGGSKLTEEDNE